jgi:hypothetical protein
VRQGGRSQAMVLGVVALLGAGVFTAPAAQALPPECGRQASRPPSVYSGAWVPAALDDPRKSLASDPLGQFTAMAGKQPSIVLRWEHWGLDNDGGVDPDWMRRVARSGSIPMYTWDPWNPNLDPPDQQQGFLLRDIAAGAHDGYVRGVARAIADYGGPIFVRFAQEMNGAWYPWAGTRTVRTSTSRPGGTSTLSSTRMALAR